MSQRGSIPPITGAACRWPGSTPSPLSLPTRISGHSHFSPPGFLFSAIHGARSGGACTSLVITSPGFPPLSPGWLCETPLSMRYTHNSRPLAPSDPIVRCTPGLEVNLCLFYQYRFLRYRLSLSIFILPTCTTGSGRRRQYERTGVKPSPRLRSP